MKLGESQQFASPEEALAHYGVKGMRWGYRKQEDSKGRDTARINAETKREMAKEISAPAGGRVTSAPVPKAVKETPQEKSQGQAEKTQRRVDEFLERADVMDTRISEIKIRNKELQGSKNPLKVYEKYGNNQTRKQLEKSQQTALKDAEAVQKGKLTSKQKKVVIGAVAVSALIGGGVIFGAATRGQQSGALNSYRLLAQARLRGQKTPFNMNKSLSGPMSASDLLAKVVKPVNPNYSSMGGKMNCRRSTYAYELRRRGFDVQATTSAVGWGQSESGVINALTTDGKDFFDRMSMSEGVAKTGFSTLAKGDTRLNPVKKIILDKLDTGGPDGTTAAFGSKKVFEALAKQPEGARGEVVFKFGGFGHSMAYEVVNGKPHVFDSQKGTYHDLTKTVESKWGSFKGAEITRLDNVDLDLKFLSRWATNTTDKPTTLSLGERVEARVNKRLKRIKRSLTATPTT